MINKLLLLHWLNTRITNLEYSARLCGNDVSRYENIMVRADALRFVRSEIEAGEFDYNEADNPEVK